MSKNNEHIGKDGHSRSGDADRSEKPSKDAERSAVKKEELDEGLDESFPGSDAPASTRRSEEN